MRAIISDVHSNIEALQAVLTDIQQQGAEEILCLGDIIGYGPDPEECIDLIEKKCRFCLSGNHDYAVLTHADRFNPLAEEAVDYTRSVLKPAALSSGRKKARWRFLELLPTRITEGDLFYVHGSPRDDRNEYILESDILFGMADKIRQIFELTPRLLFVATHIIRESLTRRSPSAIPTRMPPSSTCRPGRRLSSTSVRSGSRATATTAPAMRSWTGTASPTDASSTPSTRQCPRWTASARSAKRRRAGWSTDASVLARKQLA